MAKISTDKISPTKKVFHNEWINVYPSSLPLEKIEFWKKNNRTIFTFERLCTIKKKKLEDLSLEVITRFIAEQDIHRLQDLTDSVKRNGVQTPLIIRDDGKLLDGNRRYFASQWLKMQSEENGIPRPDVLDDIPVFIIRKADLTPALELKILAEANFIKDLKVPWSLDAQARAVEEYYSEILKGKNQDPETALAEVVGVFGIKRQRAVDLLETLDLTKQFIEEGAASEERVRRRSIIEDKFVYFWEFRNKATKGAGKLNAGTEIDAAKEMFFQFMAKGKDNPIKNVKQVEPLIAARRDKVAWSILKESKGTKLNLVVSLMNEKKEVRQSEDKIRFFLAWLAGVNDLTPKAKALLRDVSKLARDLSQ